MQNIVFIPNHFDPSTWERVEVESVIEFLMGKFDKFPENGKIYHEYISDLTDVTPYDDLGIEKLITLDNDIFIVLYPKGEYALIIGAVVAAVVAVGAAILIKPKAATASVSTTSSEAANLASPNNELQARTNEPRINGRIPDIFGKIYSTPDSIAPAYSIFVENQEVEYGYFCVGRGSYNISNIREETTVLSHTLESSVEVYRPYTSPNSGSAPQIRVNTPINKPVVTAYRNTAVNGQTLTISTTSGSGEGTSSTTISAGRDYIFFQQNGGYDGEGWITLKTDFNLPSIFQAGDFVYIDAITRHSRFDIVYGNISGTYQVDRLETRDGASFVNTLYVKAPRHVVSDGWPEHAYATSNLATIRLLEASIETTDYSAICSYPNRITFNSNIELTSKFAIGDLIFITAQSSGYNLDGTYQILALSDSIILLAAPSEINTATPGLGNPNWDYIGSGTPHPIIIKEATQHWVGPFILDQLDADKMLINLVATDGLYINTNNNISALNFTIYVEYWQVDSYGIPISDKTTTSHAMNGSKSGITIATTIEIPMMANSRYAVRCMAYGSGVIGNNVIKWRDLYAISPVSNLHFGDVTTIQTMRYGSTLSALSYKEGKLNCMAERLIKTIKNGTSGFYIDENLTFSANAFDIISHISLDTFIGNKSVGELDLNNFMENYYDIVTRFGEGYYNNSYCYPANFNYTFDDSDMSYEETVIAIAEAAFCTAYRQGNVLRVKFENYNEIPVMLFNHRNKIPNTEQRNYSFGNVNNYDGVEFVYISDVDGLSITMKAPNNDGYNYKIINSVGITNQWQAHFHAWRTWNKIKYQNNSIEFEATQEAQALIVKDNIIITDGTRPSFVEGEVLDVNGNIATLSQVIPDDWSKYNNVQMYVQLPDGTVQVIIAHLIAFINPGYTKNQVIISTPRIPLIVNDEYYAKTTYVLVPGENSEISIPKYSKYIVDEKENNENMTCNVVGINYDDRYYDRDLDRNNGLAPTT